MLKAKKEKTVKVKKIAKAKPKAALKAQKISPKAAAKKPKTDRLKGKAKVTARKVTKGIKAHKSAPADNAAGKVEPAAPVSAAPVTVKPEVEIKPQKAHQPKPAAKVEAKPPASDLPKPQVQVSCEPVVEQGLEIELEFPIILKDLAVKLQEKSSVLIKQLMSMGAMVGINQAIDEELAAKICQKYNRIIKKAPSAEDIALRMHKEIDALTDLKPRSPVVTFMGHVDHGKTSLLDAIRKTKVADGEHGGITQHIGVYRVTLPEGEITFLDTPGHEAFTAMRARGASITDIVVLVVAADDGIMPQTQEAIDHARAADVPVIVAINKIDKPQANIDMVKKQLSEAGLAAEDWGGKTITVPVSAKTGAGINNLLEMILLQAEVMELKANPKRLANGIVVEAKMAKGRGPVATLLVQNGTLHLNQHIIAGSVYGKIRAMLDDCGQAVTSAGPSCPVEVLGISSIPDVGDQFFAIDDEKQAKNLAQARQERSRQEQMVTIKKISLEDLHAKIAEGKIKELKVIIKADVRGSLEAIKDTLGKLNVSEIKLNILHAGVGDINTSDVILAVASDALILGFNVIADEPSKELIAKEGIEVKTYSIIYELAKDIKAAVEGMLEPKLKQVFLGRAEVRKVFKLSRSGTIAGCIVTKGKIHRGCVINLTRNGGVVFEGKLSSLKRFKDDVREVLEGFECGISLPGFDQFLEGDIIEAYDIEKIARKL